MSDFGSVILSAHGSEGFVELAKTSRGRLFRKQILHMDTEFEHPRVPGKKIKVDVALAKRLKRNFDSRVADIVQVPLVNDKNQHVEDPLRNIGEVVDIEWDAKGIYAIIDARKEEYAKELGNTLLGASALMHMDYPDTQHPGQKAGPTLLHVAVTNRPYITNLDGFQEIIAASADSLGDEPVVLSPAESDHQQEDNTMELDEMLAALKDEHGIDVVGLQAQVEQLTADLAAKPDTTQELVTAMSAVLTEAGVISLSHKDDEEDEKPLTIQDVADAVIELAQEKVELAANVQTLIGDRDAAIRQNAEKEIDDLVTAGRILPKQRDTMLALSMDDREKFDALLPEAPIVDLSQSGVETHDEPQESEKLAAETERLIALAKKQLGKKE